MFGLKQGKKSPKLSGEDHGNEETRVIHCCLWLFTDLMVHSSFKTETAREQVLSNLIQSSHLSPLTTESLTVIYRKTLRQFLSVANFHSNSIVCQLRDTKLSTFKLSMVNVGVSRVLPDSPLI